VTAMRRLLIGAALALSVVPLAGGACGFDDPDSIGMRRGALNLAFPLSLHVGTAVWQAQLAGRLPRDPLALREDLTPQARDGLRMMQASAALGRLALRISGASTAAARPDLAVVLLGPVLWSRFESGAVTPQVHVAGPRDGDVVIVTDLAAVEALADGDLGFGDALDLGVMRLYGPPTEVAAALRWLAQVTPD